MKPENENFETPQDELTEQEPGEEDAKTDEEEPSRAEGPVNRENSDVAGDGTEVAADASFTTVEAQPDETAGAESAETEEDPEIEETGDDSDAAVTYENGRPLVHELQYQAPKFKAAPAAEDEEVADVKFSSVSEAKAVIEGFLFSCNEPLSVAKLSRLMNSLHPKTVRGLLLELQWEYENRPGGLQVVEIAGGYQMSTRAFVAPWMFRMHKHKRRSALSPATLETLAIIAYRQPITKGEIEAIRGVESGAPVRTLQELGMVEASGRREVVGRPQLYVTTEQFLKAFGLKSVGDLPSISELKARFTEEQKLKPVVAAASFRADENPAGDESHDDGRTDLNELHVQGMSKIAGGKADEDAEHDGNVPEEEPAEDNSDNVENSDWDEVNEASEADDDETGDVNFYQVSEEDNNT